MNHDTVSRSDTLEEANETPPQAEAPEPAAADDNLVTLAADGESPRLSVLLVEDEELIAEIIGEALADYGYAVHCVADAQEALACFAAGERVDVLFTDINLPGDMDGIGLAEQVRSADPALPVVFASGRWAALEGLASLPHSQILRKPYSAQRACDAVEALVASRGAAFSDDTEDNEKPASRVLAG